MKKETEHLIWRQFDAWCRRLKLSPLPAHPWTVAAFLNHCRAQHPRTSLRAVLRQIARVHLANGQPAPERSNLVRRTLAALENRRVAPAPPRAALFHAPDLGEGEHGPKTKPAAGDAGASKNGAQEEGASAKSKAQAKSKPKPKPKEKMRRLAVSPRLRPLRRRS